MKVYTCSNHYTPQTDVELTHRPPEVTVTELNREHGLPQGHGGRSTAAESQEREVHQGSGLGPDQREAIGSTVRFHICKRDHRNNNFKWIFLIATKQIEMIDTDIYIKNRRQKKLATDYIQIFYLRSPRQLLQVQVAPRC